ncbi:LPS-assembly protein LptD [Duganella qianjiadongensis]|uniref:LPS-assembly protein LptD n=1 Tax=Duganella qianjiadongensis TaxID=2692176 RepID=A0ABW9VLW9_9BURK|nr:LPS-assembly protein LptD [Duganella qianjiadongensis]MYM40490.1 LPS assembly protein LptD [Duganella qianjiadongensis]
MSCLRWLLPPSTSPRWAYALTAIVTVSSVPGYAQSLPGKTRAPRVENKAAVTVIQAEDITGRPEREITLNRDAELVKDQTRVKADTACYKQVEDEVQAEGNVRIWRFGDYFTGDALQLNMDTGQGYMLNPTYRLEANHAQGKAERINFLNEDEALVLNGTYSTCQSANPDWYLRSNTLNLDSGRDVGTAGKTIIYFKDVPILGTPALSFSLSGARRSGWLSPMPGFGSKGAAELTVPYYLNIAPNRDLTLYPKIIPRRGFQLGANGRYLGETDGGLYQGETYLEFLPHDKQYIPATPGGSSDRWSVRSHHTQELSSDWSYGWQVRAASDNNYPNDFSKTVSSSTERQLLRELRTDYHGDFWTLTARVQKYQVLQDPESVVDPSLFVSRPYDRLPAINFHAAQYDVAGGFDWAMDSELTRFYHPTLLRGTRMVAIPQLSYPIIGASYFITPKASVNLARYDLDANDATGSKAEQLSRSVPTLSVDAGLVFERPLQLGGKEVTQTLEPRLFYVNTPYRDQSRFPTFDTDAATFNFSQIFSENRFVGSDRIGDANQLTAALVSRFLNEAGAEALRLAFGQRFYFRDQRVQLNSSTPVVDARSDMLLAATGRIAETWGFDSAVQYSPSQSRVVSESYTVQWLPGQKKVLNLGYRYLRNSFKNIDVSSQWPIFQRWYGVGRVSYSMQDKKVLESLIGLEYNSDCWVFRMGAQRFVTTSTKASTPIFFQLELNGLSHLGVGSPLEAMKNSIPGYQRLNEGYGR